MEVQSKPMLPSVLVQPNVLLHSEPLLCTVTGYV